MQRLGMDRSYDSMFRTGCDVGEQGTYIDFSTPEAIMATSPLHRIAMWAVMTDLNRGELCWSKSGQSAGSTVADGLRLIVTHGMGAGYVVWRVYRGQLQVGSPSAFSVRRSTPGGRWRATPVQSNLGRGWRVSVFRAPELDILSPTPWDWPSPTRDSCQHLHRLVQQIESFTNRDIHNSRPACFTFYDGLHQSKQSGQSSHANGVYTYPWGKLTGEPTPGPSTLQNPPDLGMLNARAGAASREHLADAIKKRAMTIRSLDEQAAIRRDRIISSRVTDDCDSPFVAGPEPVHAEHAVSDNASFRETKQLISLVDARYHHERARHGVFYALGVPPQAIGESVSSERTAANVAQYDVAISLFTQTVKSYREFASSVLEEATTIDTGDYIRFMPSISRSGLSRVLPFLTTSAATRMIARAYDIPESFVDPSKVDVSPDNDAFQPASQVQTTIKPSDSFSGETGKNAVSRNNKRKRPHEG